MKKEKIVAALSENELENISGGVLYKEAFQKGFRHGLKSPLITIIATSIGAWIGFRVLKKLKIIPFKKQKES